MATGVAGSDDKTRLLEVGAEPGADEVPVDDEDVAGLCEDEFVDLDEVADEESPPKPPFGVALAELRTTCWLDVVEFAVLDGAAAAGTASATLTPAVANPTARTAGTGTFISIDSLPGRQIAKRDNDFS
jgi:hypothetical protein